MDFNDDKALESLINLFGEEEIVKVLSEKDFSIYQNDPVGFIQKELGVEVVSDEIIQICESVRDNKTTIAQSATSVGKTFVAAALAIWYYKCYPESQIIAIAAPPESNLKDKLWSEIVQFILKSKKVFNKDRILSLKVTDDFSLSKMDDNDSEVSSKHFIVGKTIPTSGSEEERESKFSGSHARYQLFLCDEGDAIPNEVYRGIDGCMSGDGSRQLIMFNPKRRSGFAYDLIRANKANVIVLNAFNHPNVISGENLVPGAVSRDKVIERIHEWTETLPFDEEPDSSCFIVPDFLVGCVGISPSGKPYPPLKKETRRIVDQQFAYKILGIYPTQSACQLIAENWIDNAIMRWKIYVAQYGTKIDNVKAIQGMDVADEGMDHNCVCTRYGGFVAGFDRWRGIDTGLSAKRAKRGYIETEPMQLNIEGDGIGSAIPPHINKSFFLKCEKCGKKAEESSDGKCPVCNEPYEMKHFNIKKIVVSATSNHKCSYGKFDKVRDELWWAIRDWLEKDPSAMLPDIKELKEELLVAEFYENTANGKIKVTDKKQIRKKLKRSSDYVDSLMMTFHSYYSHPSVRNLTQ